MESLLAPVTDANAVFFPNVPIRPKKPKIIASLNEIMEASGRIMCVLGCCFLRSSIKKIL